MEYSNPRTKAIIEDYPIGSGARGTAIYSVEQTTRAGRPVERGVRETEKRDGTWGKPKKLTYADCVRIVDGDDGKTYIAELSRGYQMITIMQGTMKHQHESIGATSDPERYEKLLGLFA